MRFLSLIAWAAIIIPSSYAFYPYHLPDSRDFSTESYHTLWRRRTAAENLYSIPLRRMPVQRSDDYNVITASKPKLSNSLGIDQDGTDFSYFCVFQFGSSSKNFYLLLDSATSNTWVMAAGCASDACSTHNTLGTADSSSLQTSSSQFSITYGTGSVSGHVGSDTLKTAIFDVPFTFGLATNVSSDFETYAMDGIIGFGRKDEVASDPEGIEAPTLMDALVLQKKIPAKQFGIHLWRDSDGGNNDGVINFGAPDPSLYSSLNYIETVRNSNGLWELPVDDAGVGGKNVGITGRTALIDSGTSFILMPASDAQKLHGMIPGSAQNGETFTVPCDTATTVQLIFGGTKYDITTKDYVGKSMGNNQCMSNIIGRQTFGLTQWLVGDVFLKNVYTLFDFDGSRVGFGVMSTGEGHYLSSSSSSASASGTHTSRLAVQSAPCSQSEPTASTLSQPDGTSQAGSSGSILQTSDGAARESTISARPAASLGPTGSTGGSRPYSNSPGSVGVVPTGTTTSSHGASPSASGRSSAACVLHPAIATWCIGSVAFGALWLCLATT